MSPRICRVAEGGRGLTRAPPCTQKATLGRISRPRPSVCNFFFVVCGSVCVLLVFVCIYGVYTSSVICECERGAARCAQGAKAARCASCDGSMAVAAERRRDAEERQESCVLRQSRRRGDGVRKEEGRREDHRIMSIG